MALWAISDLHLAINSDKPMDIFGEQWTNHQDKIKNNWLSKVSSNDTVLIAGDISWSMNISEGNEDLEWIHNLPGTKILIKGNHDYWWNSITKLNSLFDDMNFIQNNFFSYKEYAICGTRGWNCPGSAKFSTHDEKIYDRELIRLRISLEDAVKSGYNKFIVMLHYPPTNDSFEETKLIRLIKEYNVEKVIYGHLHGASLNRLYEGNIEGVEYIVTSCDYLDFDPLKILE